MARGRSGGAELRGPRLLSAPDDRAALKAALRREAERLGFNSFGIAGPDSIPQAASRLTAFLDAVKRAQD